MTMSLPGPVNQTYGFPRHQTGKSTVNPKITPPRRKRYPRASPWPASKALANPPELVWRGGPEQLVEKHGGVAAAHAKPAEESHAIGYPREEEWPSDG
jgi:hypothetical protein